MAKANNTELKVLPLLEPIVEANGLELVDLEFVKEGVNYYNSLTEVKKSAMPYFPLGFAKFGDSIVASGFETENKIYLAVWNLNSQAMEITIPILGKEISNVSVAYPKNSLTKFLLTNDGLKISFESGLAARFFELDKNR